MPVANPYAKKKQNSSSSTAKSNDAKNYNRNSGSAVTPSHLSVMNDIPPSSFSQAFSSLEETAHYQSEINTIANNNGKNDANSHGLNQADLKARAEQRAFDAKAAATPTAAQQETGVLGNTATGNDDEISARDHHLMLQPHVLHVSTKQRGNEVLKFIRNVPFAYSKMVPDYIMSPSRCALFLSCKYHNLYPNYIHRRIAELKTDFTLRILLVLVDVEDNANALLFLNKLAVMNNLTLLLAWSAEEAARYLETFKAFDGKDASSIQKREQTNFVDQMTDVVCSIRSVNKTDSAQLLTQFGSFRAIVAASMDELGLCQGMGEKKVKRLHDAFHKPFSSRAAAKRRKQTSETKAVGGESAATFTTNEAKSVSAISKSTSKSNPIVSDETKTSVRNCATADKPLMNTT